jgi:carbonic anhydrase/acetyltransferase-like protein (isoleucine patch superfamily)
MEQQGFVAPYGRSAPTIDESVFLAPGSVVTGDVIIGAGSSIWYNAVVRGDVNYVRIGKNTNIQDLAVVHVTHDTNPTHIGSDVTIGHGATIHGCTLLDRCLVGIGAIVLDGAVIESDAMVAAGAVVTPGTRVSSGTLVAGTPAKVLRDLRPEEIENIAASAARYVAYAVETSNGLTGG